MCHNLGANESFDPFTPSVYIHGAKYKFGAKNASLSQAVDQNSTGVPGTWTNTSTYPYQSSGDWSTANNPCPSGWRLPAYAEWNRVISSSNNTWTKVGTWTQNATNYTSSYMVGDALFLPAAGFRYYTTGGLQYRGNYGYYWTGSASGSTYGFQLRFESSGKGMYDNYREDGFSVRCVAE
jgi:uncharacterized protein (TIGR02145 family)